MVKWGFFLANSHKNLVMSVFFRNFASAILKSYEHSYFVFVVRRIDGGIVC